MPAFYPRSAASALPLTPPDSGTGYAYSNMHYSQEPYASHQSLPQPRHDSAYDYPQGFLQPAVAPAPAPPAYQYQPNAYPSTTSLPSISSYYEPIGAPILPPLRIQDRMSFTDDYQRRLQQEQQSAVAREQQRQAAKEEKATGGVSAKLDYDMERMTDYVTSMTEMMYAYLHSSICLADIDVTRSFKRTVVSHPAFRKWVHQVLSATRLPSATILLSLHYLNDRLRRWPESVPAGDNSIYRMLAVSLILGSKFLDDNTFINRSWSDVTSIKVTELNMLEWKWLELIDYTLHVEPTAAGGLQSWLDSWKQYDTQQSVKQNNVARLSPLDTNIHRHSSNSNRYSPYPTPQSAVSARAFDAPYSARASQYGSTPYTASDPWASSDRHTFDDFYKRQHRYPTLTEIDDANRRASQEQARQSAYYSQAAPTQPSYYQPPTYNPSAWDSYGWNGVHRSDCGCSSCTYQHHYRPYSMASSYAAQTVMG